MGYEVLADAAEDVNATRWGRVGLTEVDRENELRRFVSRVRP